MKRQSIAERTLNKQINVLNQKLEEIFRRKRELDLEYETTRDIRDDLISEINRLYSVRVSASEKAKS